MTLDQTVLIWCVAVPAVLVAVGCLIAKWSSQAFRGLIISTAWWLAVTAALIGCQGWQWWPEDAWRQAIWPLLAWVVLICATFSFENRLSCRWVVAGVLSIATAVIAMPSGQGWEDTLPMHRMWLGLIATSCLVNCYSLEQLSRACGHRWSLLVALAGLGGPMALAAATYGSLAQWTLAMIIATLVAAAWGVFSEFNSAYWTAAIPAAVGAAGITGAGRFYSYETYPAWVYAAILFGPSLVTLVDFVIRSRATWMRVLVSAIASAAVVAVGIWNVLLS